MENHEKNLKMFGLEPGASLEAITDKYNAYKKSFEASVNSSDSTVAQNSKKKLDKLESVYKELCDFIAEQQKKQELSKYYDALNLSSDATLDEVTAKYEMFRKRFEAELASQDSSLAQKAKVKLDKLEKVYQALRENYLTITDQELEFGDQFLEMELPSKPSPPTAPAPGQKPSAVVSTSPPAPPRKTGSSLKLNDDNMTGKSLWTALGLNLLLLGAGFFYMGRKVVGVFLMIVSALAYLAWGPVVFLVLIGCNLAAAIDLAIYARRMKVKSFRDCPRCGNQVKRTAKFCAACQTEIGATA